jgi:hypothetical protein
VSDTFNRPVGKIVCRRQHRDLAFKRDDQVIRKTETDEARSGNFVAYCEDSRLAWVFWAGTTEAIKVPLSNLMHIADWKAAREQQANLKNYWTN